MCEFAGKRGRTASILALTSVERDRRRKGVREGVASVRRVGRRTEERRKTLMIDCREKSCEFGAMESTEVDGKSATVRRQDDSEKSVSPEFEHFRAEVDIFTGHRQRLVLMLAKRFSVMRTSFST